MIKPLHKYRVHLLPGPAAPKGTERIRVPEIRAYYWFKTPANKWAYYRLVGHGHSKTTPKKVSSRNTDPIQATYEHVPVDGLAEIDLHDNQHNRDLITFLKWYKRKYRSK